MGIKKIVILDKRGDKEIKKFPSIVREKVKALLIFLGNDGQLEEPEAKKIDKNLFELRIKYQGQWRVLYAYIVIDQVVVLSAFQKKTQKTPQKELSKARQRLKEYV